MFQKAYPPKLSLERDLSSDYKGLVEVINEQNQIIEFLLKKISSLNQQGINRQNYKVDS